MSIFRNTIGNVISKISQSIVSNISVISDWILRSDLIYRLEVNEESKKLNVYLKNEAQREVGLNKTNELVYTYS